MLSDQESPRKAAISLPAFTLSGVGHSSSHNSGERKGSGDCGKKGTKRRLAVGLDWFIYFCPVPRGVHRAGCIGMGDKHQSVDWTDKVPLSNISSVFQHRRGGSSRGNLRFPIDHHDDGGNRVKSQRRPFYYRVYGGLLDQLLVHDSGCLGCT